MGGWAESGTDPSLFAESLAYHMGQSTVRMPGRSPVDVINVGYEGVLNDDMVKCGSATACVVSMDSSARVLEAAKCVPGLVSIKRILRGTDSTFNKQPW